jgi:hypothetical protein
MSEWAKRIGKAFLVAFATFAISLPISCFALTVHFEHLYPHDGQNGLGGIYFGFIISALLSAATFFTILLSYGFRAIRNGYYD